MPGAAAPNLSSKGHFRGRRAKFSFGHERGAVSMNIMVISAISRETSTCYVLARQLVEMCEQRGVTVDFATPANAGLPLNDGTVPDDLPAAKAWQARVEAIHCHLWVSPEYHGGLTGAMKNLFDFLPKEPMRGDAVGLFALAGGAMAALNTLNGMAVVARSLGAWVAPEFCALNSNDVKAGLDAAALKRVDRLVETVIDMGRRLYSAPPDIDPTMAM
jgi:azobenzene reductase